VKRAAITDIVSEGRDDFRPCIGGVRSEAEHQRDKDCRGNRERESKNTRTVRKRSKRSRFPTNRNEFNNDGAKNVLNGRIRTCFTHSVYVCFENCSFRFSGGRRIECELANGFTKKKKRDEKTDPNVQLLATFR